MTSVFDLEIPSCTVYFNNHSDASSMQYITVTNFSPDVKNYIIEKERLLFTHYPHTRICKLIKEKTNYSLFIKLNFGKNYVLLDNDRNPAYTYELRPGTKVAVRVFAREWSYKRQAGYVLYVKHLIILDPVEVPENNDEEQEIDEELPANYDDEFYKLEQKIIKSFAMAEEQSNTTTEGAPIDEQIAKTKFKKIVKESPPKKENVRSNKLKLLN
jgi:hypothetical protein